MGEKKPTPKNNIIPELLERNHFAPAARAMASFATAHFGLPHKVVGCEFQQDATNPNKMNVSVNMNIQVPKDVPRDYIMLNIPIVIPLPRGSLFETGSSPRDGDDE